MSLRNFEDFLPTHPKNKNDLQISMLSSKKLSKHPPHPPLFHISRLFWRPILAQKFCNFDQNFKVLAKLANFVLDNVKKSKKRDHHSSFLMGLIREEEEENGCDRRLLPRLSIFSYFPNGKCSIFHVEMSPNQKIFLLYYSLVIVRYVVLPSNIVLYHLEYNI